jgi:hypothetical protein
LLRTYGGEKMDTTKGKRRVKEEAYLISDRFNLIYKYWKTENDLYTREDLIIIC